MRLQHSTVWVPSITSGNITFQTDKRRASCRRGSLLVENTNPEPEDHKCDPCKCDQPVSTGCCLYKPFKFCNAHFRIQDDRLSSFTNSQQGSDNKGCSGSVVSKIYIWMMTSHAHQTQTLSYPLLNPSCREHTTWDSSQKFHFSCYRIHFSYSWYIYHCFVI